jgi:BirA family biotin operon repressor/biotin-[acetyl-CoA-carboxylase] ligase
MPQQRKLQNDPVIFQYSLTDSTNKRAKEYATPSFSGHALFLADSQTEGRGRLGRSFYSPSGTGLYLSYLFSTKEPLSAFSALTPACAVVCARALEKRCDSHVGIKWVNDLYVDGKKVCGILTEAIGALNDGEQNRIVVGVGINLSTEVFPPEIAQIAGSLGIESDKKELALDIARGLSVFAEDPYDRSFMEEYRNRSTVLGKEVCLVRGEERFCGRACDFDENGGIVLDLQGERRLFTGGEISLRFLNS